MIELDELTKTFPGMDEPAVDRVSMSIPRGEIVVLVGPSGCGKTTTMKMINRLIEPTSGRIVLDGEDVTDQDPNVLRRRIGYVIQQIGLFPHRTIAQNIATVPDLLGWEQQRTDDRIDELLDAVGLDPVVHRDRFPRELSGGQRQRVGVARAMAADPPVMLMDEPYGAIDPITRTHLLNEFLRLQAEIQKTIIFVTHDIDEAIKMGDRIAILREHSHIAQFDTPENILTAPASDFVRDFVGSGASLKRLNLSRVRDLDLSTAALPTGTLDEGVDTLRTRLHESEWTSLLLLDDTDRPQRWIRPGDLRDGAGLSSDHGLPARALVEPNATLHDALDEMLVGSVGCAIVVDDRGRYQDIVDIDDVMAAIREMREADSEYYRLLKQTELQGA
jgi:osmoprotectant transport system ATP-binding protein